MYYIWCPEKGFSRKLRR